MLLRTIAKSFGLLRHDKGIVACLVGGNIGLAIASFVEPVLFGRIVDRLTRSDDAPGGVWQSPVVLTASWIVVGLLAIGCSVLVALHSDRLAHRNRLKVVTDFFARAVALPQGFHTDHHSARLTQIMTEGSAALVALWLPFFRDQCSALLVLLVTLPAALVLNWRLGLILLASAGLSGASTALVLRRTRNLQDRAEEYHARVSETTADVFANLPVIQSFTRSADEIAQVRRLADELLRVQLPVLNWWALAAMAARVSTTLTLIAVLLLGLALKARGLASVGDIVAFMSLAALVTARLGQVVGFCNQLALNIPKLTELFGVLRQRSTLPEANEARDPGRLSGHVVFEGVTFSYDGQRDAVSELRFEAAPGELVALVGATGSGKTTTLSLLHRVFDPDRGRVTIDGIDVRDMPLQGLRRNIGVVFQEPMLLKRTIADNVKVGHPQATEEDVRHALVSAQADDFVSTQAAGAATVLGQNGRTLSGGERQRLSIARALLKDAPILILDEPTSALDPATERDVQAALSTAKHKRTVLVIAHRLSTIRHADRILVFDKGRVVESGRFEELAERSSHFRRLMGVDPVPAAASSPS